MKTKVLAIVGVVLVIFTAVLVTIIKLPLFLFMRLVASEGEK